MIALADQNLIRVPGKRLALGAVAPADHGTAAPERSGGKILESYDLLDGGRLRGVHGVEPTVGGARVNPLLVGQRVDDTVRCS